MPTSSIVVLIVIVAGLATIPFITRGLHVLFKDYMALEEHKEDKKSKIEASEAKDKLKETIDNGSLGELLEVAKDFGEKKR